MRERFTLSVGLCVLGALLAGCLFGGFDDSDKIVSVDKTVTQAELSRITSHLLASAPKIRAEKTRLVKEHQKVALTLSILSAPDPGHPKSDPDYRYHASYYWVYVSYMGKDSLLKYDTYLVHKDLADIYYVDSETDAFVKVGA